MSGANGSNTDLRLSMLEGGLASANRDVLIVEKQLADLRIWIKELSKHVSDATGAVDRLCGRVDVMGDAVTHTAQSIDLLRELFKPRQRKRRAKK